MRKFLSIFFALVLCVSAMVVIASAATQCPEHDWSAWTTVKVENGNRYQERYCACGDNETRVLHESHTYFLETVEAVAPTCKENGNIEYKYCTYEGCDWMEAAGGVATNPKSVIVPAAHTLEKVEAKAPTCLELGNVEYFACTACDYIELNGAEATIEDVQIAVLDHTIEHVEAVAPTCDADGNSEYWYCTECGHAWFDEARHQQTNLKSVNLPATHKNVVHIEAVAPACHYIGNVEYWYCEDCDKVWTNEGQTEVSNHKNVILPALGGEVAHVAAVAAGCETEGNIEYWYCATCEQVWQDEALTQLTNIKNVVLPATHQNVVHIEAVAPACHYIGNVEYWYCADCDMVWTNEGQTEVSNHKNVILPALGGEVAHVAAVATGCETEGNIEYWYCATCEQVWQDEALTQLTNIKNVILPATHKNVVHIEAVAPACHYIGNVEYWYCADCDMVWTNEGQTEVSNHKNVILPALGGEVAHVAAVVPGCETMGNIEYWHCATCEQVWQDEALTQLTNIKNVILPATHQNIEHVAAVAPTCTADGNIEYWYCTVCGYAWENAELTLVSNLQSVKLGAAHALVKVDAKAATCTENGNMEYWYCSACDWVEVAGGVASNLKAVQTPAAHSLVKVDAKAATCFELGNMEYWYCSACDWVEVAGGVASNLKSVVLPIVHNIEHVAAKAATATENGNIEHWYCKDCGYAWLDELCTKNTNLKAVILPATGEEPTNPKTGDNAIFFVVALVAVATLGVAAVSFKKREN